MIYVFYSLAGIYVLSYIIMIKRIRNISGNIDIKKNTILSFISVGFLITFFFEKVFYTKGNLAIAARIFELYGPVNTTVGLRMHRAKRITYIYMVMTVFSLVFHYIGVQKNIVVLFVLLIILVVYLNEEDVKKKLDMRRRILQKDFPVFLNMLVLLLNAGLDIRKACERIAALNDQKGLLYEEIKKTVNDMQSGKPGTQAFEEFAKRCRIPEITRFVTLIIQNIKKGNNELVSLLRVNANECWLMRKSAVKKLGEEASTKMLFPVTLMFIGVLIIVMTPAVLALKSF